MTLKENGARRAVSRKMRADEGSDIIAAEAGIPPMAGIIGYKLRRAQLFVFQDFLETFAKLKLRPAEFSVLALIAQNPGRKQIEIAEALGIKRTNFVALMDGLERRGLAERRRGGSDRRAHSLYLTPDGQRFVKKMVGLWQKHEDVLIAKLGGARERDRLIELLDRLLGPMKSAED
jgi:DNA-binding MarR family transcriptional regulator